MEIFWIKSHNFLSLTPATFYVKILAYSFRFCLFIFHIFEDIIYLKYFLFAICYASHMFSQARKILFGYIFIIFPNILISLDIDQNIHLLCSKCYRHTMIEAELIILYLSNSILVHILQIVIRLSTPTTF